MRNVSRRLAVCCLAVLAAACTRPLDRAEVESEISTQLAERFAGSTWSVACPDGVQPEAGATFRCSATSDTEQRFGITVTQDDAKGSLTWQITGTG